MHKEPIHILAIETSCDETSASVVKGDEKGVEVLSNVVSSQVKLHAKWGGVVPNLAAREHVKNIIPVIESSLKESKLSYEKIDALAVTQGPGLIPALLIGTNSAKSIAYAWKKPLIGIHHIEGHIYANFIGDYSKIEFPALCLVVSGGHTQLVFMKNHLEYEIVGQTQDDAAGEAFDKVARILNLGYPGGPIVSQKAQDFQTKFSNENNGLTFPRPMLNSGNFNFSFSGLKTAVLYETKKHLQFLHEEKYIAKLCYEFQQAVIDVLTTKTIKAAREYLPKTIMLAGGVSANKELREHLGKTLKENFPDIDYYVPKMEYCGDNAAMIGCAAFFQYQKNKNLKENWKDLKPDANFKLTK